MNAAEITDKLGLHSLRNRNWYIQATCATSGDGLYEGLDWLSNQLKNAKWTWIATNYHFKRLNIVSFLAHSLVPLRLFFANIFQQVSLISIQIQFCLLLFFFSLAKKRHITHPTMERVDYLTFYLFSLFLCLAYFKVFSSMSKISSHSCLMITSIVRYLFLFFLSLSSSLRSSGLFVVIWKVCSLAFFFRRRRRENHSPSLAEQEKNTHAKYLHQ